MPIGQINNSEAGSTIRAKLNAMRAALNVMGTQADAALGRFIGIARTAATWSVASGSTGSIGTTHNRVVIGSSASTVNATRASVISCNSVSVTGATSSAIASSGPSIESTDGFSALIGATGSGGILAAANRAAIIGSTNSSCSARETSIISSNSSTASARQAAVIASDVATASGQRSAVIASLTDAIASGPRSLIAACDDSRATEVMTACIGANFSRATAGRAVVLGARRVINNTVSSLAMGDAASGDPLTANRKIHLFSVTGNISISGSLTPGVVFTDYVELFANGEGVAIAPGILLTLDGSSMRKALPGEPVFGVSSETGAVIAGDTAFTWARRYLRDDFGQMLFDSIPDPDWPANIPDPDWESEVADPDWQEQIPDPSWQPEIPNPSWLSEVIAGNPDAPRFIANPNDQQMIANPTPRGMVANPQAQPTVPNPVPAPIIEVPRENPEFDPQRENIPRTDRPDEWVKVGLLGQVNVRIDDSVIPGQPIAPGPDGIAIASGSVTGVRCMAIKRAYDANLGYGVGLCLINVRV